MVKSLFQSLHLASCILARLKVSTDQRALDAIEELSTLIPALELPLAAGRHYGDIRAQLNAQGQPIGGNDLWIAAHALAADLILVSNNTREFERIPQLKLENWTLS